MNYKYKSLIFQLLLFSIEWMLFNYQKIMHFEKISEIYTFSGSLMNSGLNYNNLIFLGMYQTVFYVCMFHFEFRMLNPSVIIRYGRHKYINNCIKKTFAQSFLFAFEFWLVNTIGVIIFCELQFLADIKFYLCNILYLLTLYLFFQILGTATLLIRSIFDFSKLYMLATILVFCFLSLLGFLGIKISPIFFSSFIDDWFINSRFDAFSYIRNILICIVIIMILVVANKLIFIKKDILIDAEEN